MILGFTGTQQGMTLNQKVRLAQLLSFFSSGGVAGAWWISKLHHGTCVGADDQFHRLCMWFGWRDKIVLHPPESTAKSVIQHFIDVPDSQICEPKPYLERNKDIVIECDTLIAAPKTMDEELRSGTWATIRYAHKQNRPIHWLEP